ncbi:MAG: LytR C-terminal domain-containing protein [Nocardioidaceae bacterium]|nr:LytR C-terminal domain-containing protein [Nocardioidaceae bacterium]MCL2612940.1 LytR C-terminal domain-containing protein [Nocardioidaceae bacterium]
MLALILVIGVFWALHSVSAPFPGRAAAPPICEDTSVSAGDTVQTGEVLVNVLNAGNRSGLADETRSRLTHFGFGEGDLGNAPSSKHLKRHMTAQVWAADPRSPAAKLVASYLGKHVTIKRHAVANGGITVVVGDGFHRVHRGLESIKAHAATTVCEPTATPNGANASAG